MRIRLNVFHMAWASTTCSFYCSGQVRRPGGVERAGENSHAIASRHVFLFRVDFYRRVISASEGCWRKYPYKLEFAIFIYISHLAIGTCWT